jgi:enterochelin esterase-like enzyme
MAYRIYLPPCYGLDGRVYPTLYLLPGNIHSDTIWDELGIDEAAENAILGQAIPPLLIVMPEGGQTANNTSGGPYSYEGVILNDLIPFIEATYCAWSEAAGRAIGGLSRGGYWALEIAFRHPAHFVSVGGHSAALLDIAAGPELNPQYTGLNNNLGSLRIYLDIGANDYVMANIRRLHEDMAAAGIPHTWVLNEGRHENAYWAAHIADYLTWYTTAWLGNRAEYPVCSIP